MNAFLEVDLVQVADDLDEDIKSTAVYVESSIIHGLSTGVTIKIMDQAPVVLQMT